ncbi:MAG: hypothetical protein WCV92_01435 [Candidatus Buchananbacteria bacterium]
MEGGKNKLLALLKNKDFFLGLVLGLAVIVIISLVFWIVFSVFNKQPSTSSTFRVNNNSEICQEDGKPVVYLFSTSNCSHCLWIKDTFDKIVRRYVASGKIKAYHYDLDSGDDLLTSETEKLVPKEAFAVFNEFNPGGGVPTFVFGCKYYRIGNGYEQNSDLNAEANEFEIILNKLINK